MERAPHASNPNKPRSNVMHCHVHPRPKNRPSTLQRRVALAALGLGVLAASAAFAEQPPAPCHPNPNAAADSATVANRGDVSLLPKPLKDRLVQLADRPHSYLPL